MTSLSITIGLRHEIKKGSGGKTGALDYTNCRANVKFQYLKRSNSPAFNSKYRTSDVSAGSDVPYVLKGTVFKATFLSQSLCIRLSVISDLKSPGDIEFTLIPCFPISMAIICHNFRHFGKGMAIGEITSDAGVVNQGIDTAKRIPSPLHGGLDCGPIRTHIELHGHRGELPAGVRLPGAGTSTVDFIAERLKPVDSASRGDDSATGFGQVQAELSAQPRRRSGDHHHLVPKAPPRLHVGCHLATALHYSP
nr:receptor like protein [Ipomoea trifida]